MILNWLCACAVTLGAGWVQQSTPPNGTWWESDRPASFGHHGAFESVGVAGNAWSVEVASLGTITSDALAGDTPSTPGGKPVPAHWHGQEKAYGAWAAWEPHFHGAFLQVGPGVVRLDFTEHIPDWYGCLPDCGRHDISVHNNGWYPSWMVGGGYHWNRADLIVSYRSTAAYGGHDPATPSTPGNFTPLSKTALSAALRFRF